MELRFCINTHINTDDRQIDGKITFTHLSISIMRSLINLIKNAN